MSSAALVDSSKPAPPPKNPRLRYNGHCFGFSCEALGGFITKPSAIIKLHVATKQWYTVRLALTEDGSAHPDGPLEIESHSTEPVRHQQPICVSSVDIL